jgi:hypothetical protein
MLDMLPAFEESKSGLFAKGIVGTATPILAVLTSFQEQVEWYLRVAGLIGALIVSILTIVSLLRKKK